MHPKIGVWVAKARSCDMPGLLFLNINPPKLCWVEEVGSQKLRGNERDLPRNFCDPPGGVHVFKNKVNRAYHTFAL